jgi:hypothetical protein
MMRRLTGVFRMSYNDDMPSSGSTYVVSTTAVLNAPPHRVYETIANYHTGHPRILAKQISGLEVERGGIGEGTLIRFQVTAFGKTESLRAEITEPEPGHMLVETALGRHSVTTFVVDAGAHGGESVVTIKTELMARPGLGGVIERFLTARLLRSMYGEQLRLLEAVAAGPPGTAASTNSRA